MTDFPSSAPRDVPQLGPVDVPWTSPFRTFAYLFFKYKTVTDVEEELLHLKNTFFIKLSIFCWSPEGPGR